MTQRWQLSSTVLLPSAQYGQVWENKINVKNLNALLTAVSRLSLKTIQVQLFVGPNPNGLNDHSRSLNVFPVKSRTADVLS